jgi:hypothetical protein
MGVVGMAAQIGQVETRERDGDGSADHQRQG